MQPTFDWCHGFYIGSIAQIECRDWKGKISWIYFDDDYSKRSIEELHIPHNEWIKQRYGYAEVRSDYYEAYKDSKIGDHGFVE
jgi:hypothetical protein